MKDTLEVQLDSENTNSKCNSMKDKLQVLPDFKDKLQVLPDFRDKLEVQLDEQVYDLCIP